MYFYIVLLFTLFAVSEETSDNWWDDNKNVLRVSDRCYWTIITWSSFTDAHKRCQAEGGILAEIPNQEAQTKIQEFLNNRFYWIWIGVNDKNEEGSFVNMLNETVKYTNWAIGEPDQKITYSDVDVNCVAMGNDGTWFNISCLDNYYALCSQRHSIEQIQNQSPTLPVPYTNVHTTALSTVATDLSTISQATSERISDQSTTKNYQTVSQTTSEQISDHATIKNQQPVSKTSEQSTTLSSTHLTTVDQLTESPTSVQTFTQPTTTDSPSIPKTSMQTTSSVQQTTSSVQQTTFSVQQTTFSVQSTVGTTIHVSPQRECMCPCTRMKNLVIIENEAELLTKIDNIKKELAVKKSLLSSSIRKRTSAVDPRPSASIVGGTISVVIIATVVGLIVLSDLTRLINFCWKIISKRWNRKTRAAQKEKV